MCLVTFQNVKFSETQTSGNQQIRNLNSGPPGAGTSHWELTACTPTALSMLGATVLNGGGVSWNILVSL